MHVSKKWLQTKSFLALARRFWNDGFANTPLRGKYFVTLPLMFILPPINTIYVIHFGPAINIVWVESRLN